MGSEGMAPNKNLLSRALGIELEVGVDTRVIDVAPGDYFLVCSDGLCGYAEDDEIAALMATLPGRGLAEGCRALRDLAFAKKSTDNVTVILARCP